MKKYTIINRTSELVCETQLLGVVSLEPGASGAIEVWPPCSDQPLIFEALESIEPDRLGLARLAIEKTASGRWVDAQ